MNFGCTSSLNNDEWVEFQDDFMGTVVTQKIFGKRALEAYNRVTTEICRLENLMSFFKKDSDVSRLNQMAGKGEVILSYEVIHTLNEALKYSVLSDGAFEITLGLLSKLWRDCGKHAKVPEQNEVNELLKYTGYKALKIDYIARTASLSHPKVAVDLGGIGKGFAADIATKIYTDFGLTSAFIDLGGNVKTLGRKPDGTEWVIGVQHPDAPRGILLGVLMVSGQSVVTSGGYERYFAANGTKFHHILDPRSGWPSDAGLKSTTIICEDSMKADALATATFIMGMEKGMNLIGKMTGVEAIFVTEKKEVYVTRGLRDCFVLSDQNNLEWGESHENYRICW